ncbi:MAG TPA: RIP metalloprotease RseP [Planctomycetota bacterium]|nr:RIP metalloprotease RseP [Planctomycetota bacterium]
MIRDLFGSGLSILLVIVGLGLIIFIHELGHFLMAKKNKVKVEVFSLGFGPAIWKFRRGETEYRVSWFPLGGYVKMAGETMMDADRKGEAWELTSKTPWQRFQIFVAGATMNLLIAYPIGVAAYVLGMPEMTNLVGKPGVAESRGGMLPGDEIVKVGDRGIQGIEKFRIEMIRRQTGVTVPVTVVRDGKKVELQVTTMRSSFHQTYPAAISVGEVVPGSVLGKAGVQEADELVSVDGERLYSGNLVDDRLRGSPGKEVSLTFRRRSPDFNDSKTIDVRVALKPKDWFVIPADDNLKECIVRRIESGSAAYDILEPEDVIKRIGDEPVACWADLRRVVEKSANVPLKVTLLRKGESREFTITPSVSERGTGAFGIEGKSTNVFARVVPGSFWDKAGVKTGDVLFSIDGVPGEVTLDGTKAVPGILGVRDTKPRKVKIEVKRAGEAKPIAIEIQAEKRTEADLAEAGFKVGSQGGLAIGEAKVFRRRPFGDAVSAGLREPFDLFVMTFDVLRKLVTGNESAKGLSGPIGIIQASYHFAQMSFGKFLWLLCLITVNLGVFNLLPIPVLDGGHNVLLLIEVVRKWFGKPPPSEKFVASFQYAGLLFILALFLLVTYNDLSRIWNRGG